MYAPTPQPAFQQEVRFSWISESWSVFSSQAGTWIVTTIFFFVISWLISALVGLAVGLPAVMSGAYTTYPGESFSEAWSKSMANPLQLVFGGVRWIVYSYFASGLYAMANAQVRMQPTNIGMLFTGYRNFPKMLAYTFLASLLMFLGYVALIVPGIILTGMLMPGYALVADGMSPIQAINTSINATKKSMGQVLLLVLLLFVIALIACIPIFLGLLVVLPMACIVSSLMYRDMIGMPMPNLPMNPFQYMPQQPGMWPPPPSADAPPDNASQQ